MRIVIIGGGISGLAAAHRLQRASRASDGNVHVTLLESSERLGGKILTDRFDGLTIEGGPDSFLSSKTAALQLCEELGLGERVIGTTESGGGTFILRNGRLEPLPEGITMLVPTRLRPLLRSRLLSPLGKMRMGLDVFIPPRSEKCDESVGHFVRRRLGREAFERMAQPLLSGIYAGDAEQLSLLATFPRLRETELRYGSLTRGMLAQRRQARQAKPTGPRRSAFISLRDGVGELIDGLVAAIPDVEIHTNTSATTVEPCAAGGYLVSTSSGQQFEADGLIFATPAYTTADLLDRLDPDLTPLLRQIPYVSTATVTLGYHTSDIERRSEGRGFVIPKVEDRELTAVTWATNKFAGRAPDDIALVRAFVGRAGREAAVDLPDADLLQLVRRELREILGISAEPALARVYRWHRALPQYVLGHTERLEQIEGRVARIPGVRLSGSAYRGVGIPDCIQSGQIAAEQLLEGLKK
ncbi:MAG TPA: protoporphyrinogen oxidase [Nitrolancea sp.]|nr:protoporphyrinogen oxidase [Nitrolancea sp.]